MAVSCAEFILLVLQFFFAGTAIETVRRRLSSKSVKPWLTCFIDALLSCPSYLKLGPWGRKNDCTEALKKAIVDTGSDFIGDGDNSSFLQKYEISRKLGVVFYQNSYNWKR